MISEGRRGSDVGERRGEGQSPESRLASSLSASRRPAPRNQPLAAHGNEEHEHDACDEQDDGDPDARHSAVTAR